jgi:hypothetical protein
MVTDVPSTRRAEAMSFCRVVRCAPAWCRTPILWCGWRTRAVRLLVIDRGQKTERYMLSLTKLLVDQLLLPAAQDS